MNLKPTLEELENEQCKLHTKQNMLMFIDEPKRSKFGKFCPLCQMTGLSRY